MKVLTEGHKYELLNFEISTDRNQTIQFIEKVPIENQPGALLTVNNGTTNEEVVEMLLDRMNFLQAAFPCRENAIVITKLDEALLWLNKRTADRMKRNVEGKHLK